MVADDFFHVGLDSMVDMRHPLAVLATRMPWVQIEASLAPLLAHKDRSGRFGPGCRPLWPHGAARLGGDPRQISLRRSYGQLDGLLAQFLGCAGGVGEQARGVGEGRVGAAPSDDGRMQGLKLVGQGLHLSTVAPAAPPRLGRPWPPRS